MNCNTELSGKTWVIGVQVEKRKNGTEKKMFEKIWMDKCLKLILKKASNLMDWFGQTMKPHQRQPPHS